MPFYTKVQTSAAIGEGPDVMTYHLSRLPLGVDTGTLREITPDELTAAGLRRRQLRAGQLEGRPGRRQAIRHPVRYPRGRPLLQQGHADGRRPARRQRPAERPRRRRQFQRRAGEAQGRRLRVRRLDPHRRRRFSQWRIFYSLFGQQDGKFLSDDGKFLAGDNLDKAVKATSVDRQMGRRRAGAELDRLPGLDRAVHLAARRPCTSTASGKSRPSPTSPPRASWLRVGRHRAADVLRPPGDLGRLPCLRHSRTARARRSRRRS